MTLKKRKKKKKGIILKNQTQAERKKFQTQLIFDLLLPWAEHFFDLKLI